MEGSVHILEALFLAVMTGIADDTERNDGGSRVEFKIFTAGKIDGAEILGEGIWICFGLALCFSGIAGSTAGGLDGRVRRRNGKGFQSKNGICCGWVVRTFSGVADVLAVTYPGRSSVALCTFSLKQTGGREYNDIA